MGDAGFASSTVAELAGVAMEACNPFKVTCRSGSYTATLLGGSWVVVSRVTSRVTLVITYLRGPITPLIATHEPPSTPYNPKPKIL